VDPFLQAEGVLANFTWIMNIHHLELFYYVAKHGGISAAARHIPYGVQQPAISSQMLQLEDELGCTLFQRRPFTMTPEGDKLFAYVQSFFAGLPELENELRGGAQSRLRLAAPEIVQREYLPVLMRQMTKKNKAFHFTLVHARQQEIEKLLQAMEIDLGLALISNKPAPGLHSRELLQLRPVMLVQAKSRYKSAEELFRMNRMEVPLITPEGYEVLTRSFLADLKRREVEWLPALELSGIDLIARYVAEGFGVGIIVQMPRMSVPAGVRVLELPDFTPICFGALWRGKLNPLQESFLTEVEALAEKLRR
jgi:DNA-binding transcriptional LysR family regulator